MVKLRIKLKMHLALMLIFCLLVSMVSGALWEGGRLKPAWAQEPASSKAAVMAEAEFKLVPEYPIPISQLSQLSENAIRTGKPVTMDQLGHFSVRREERHYAGLFSGTVFQVGRYGAVDTVCVVVFVKPVSGFEDYPRYTMTGEESYIFLYVNRTEQDYNLRINLENYQAKIVTVPSVATICTLTEGENKKEASSSDGLREPFNISMVRYEVPFVGEPIAGEFYEGAAKDPQEEYNLMRGLPADYDEDEDLRAIKTSNPYGDRIDGRRAYMAPYFAAVMELGELLGEGDDLAFSDGATPADATPSAVTPSTVTPSTVTPSAVTPSTITPSAAIMPAEATPSAGATPADATPSNVPPSSTATPSVPWYSHVDALINRGAVGVSQEIVKPEVSDTGGAFKVSFFDYDSPSIGEYPNRSIMALPGSKNEKLFIGAHRFPSYGDQNKWVGHILGVPPGRDGVAFSGIAGDTYDADGRIRLSYASGPLFGSLGPGSQPNMRGITRYENVTVQEKGENSFFQYDVDGGFVFDSSVQRAALLKAFGAEGKSEYVLTGSLDHGGGFFPLNGYGERQGGNYNEGSLNNYFGMALSFQFIMPQGGMITGDSGSKKPMVFDFVGDDDVWVYLRKAGSTKGRLALDLGGIHSRAGGRIDFATGLITHDSVLNEGKTGGEAVYWYLYDDKGVGDQVAGRVISRVVGLSKAAWEEYSLDFYFMERGGDSSNCRISANMPAIPEDRVTVYKSVCGSTGETSFKMELQTKQNGVWEPVEVRSVGKNQKTQFSTALPKGTRYKIVERDSGAMETEWKIGDRLKLGKESPSAVVGIDDLAVCTNRYDFAPTIKKRAVQAPGQRDGYWISLEVTGNSTIQERKDTPEEKKYGISTVRVEDVLSQWVDFQLKGDVPSLVLELKRRGESEFTRLPLKVEAVSTGGYRMTDGGNQDVGAIDKKNIRWNAVEPSFGLDGFDEASTVRLSYLVRVEGNAEYLEDEAEYPDEADGDTGTHSGLRGYYSNERATADYTTQLLPGVGTLVFPKPVVRPTKPKACRHSLKISKVLARDSYKAAPDYAANFHFDAGFTDEAGKPLLQVGCESAKGVTFGSGVILQNGILTLKDGTIPFTMKAGGSLVLSDILDGTGYWVTEGSFAAAEAETYYTSELLNIEQTGQERRKGNALPAKIPGNTSLSTVTGSFCGDVEGDCPPGSLEVRELVFENRITPIRKSITINKRITDRQGHEITNDGNGETFIYEIINSDSSSPGWGEKFYAGVTTENGKGSVTVRDVFAGTYEIKELDHLRFKPVNGKNVCEIVAAGKEPEYASFFSNYRSSKSYYSATNAAVNEVGDDGFIKAGPEEVKKNKNPPQGSWP